METNLATVTPFDLLVRAARVLYHRGDDGGTPINRNGEGFGKSDYNVAKAILLRVDTGTTAPTDAWALERILGKYRRQLGDLGIDLGALAGVDGDTWTRLRGEERVAAVIPPPTRTRDPAPGWERTVDATDAPPKPPVLLPPMADVLGPSGVIARTLPGYEARPGQVTLAEAIARAVAGRESIAAEAGTGSGKALDVETPIPTLHGWRRMGDIVAGDIVFDEKGRPCTVTHAWDVQFNRSCFDVRFSDGTSLIADAEHQWASWTRVDRKQDNRYFRAPRLKRQTYGSTHALAAIETAIPRYSVTAEIGISDVLALTLGKHDHLVRSAARTVRYTTSATRSRQYPAQNLLDAILESMRRTARDQRRDTPSSSIVTTTEMAETLRAHGNDLNHAIAVAKPVQYPTAELPLPPYFFGIWLGDGSSRSNQITTSDEGVIEAIKSDGLKVCHLKAKYLYAVHLESGPARNRWEPCVTKVLRSLGVTQNKHIPEQYRTAEESQRRSLLAGLLDSDGTAGAGGGVIFGNTNRQLAEDVFELIASLGYRPSLSSKPARLYGKDCGIQWSVTFSTCDRVFRLERKHQAHQDRSIRNAEQRRRFRYVTDVRPVESRPVRCIAVDSPNHLYLAGRAYVPTHNSLAYLIPAILSSQTTIVSTEGKTLQDQLATKDLPFLARVLPRPFSFTVLKGLSNYACFSADTRVLTRYGTRHIGDIAGTRVELLDGNGNWAESEVKSFGYQQVWQLKLTRDGREKTIFTTSNHRWFVNPNANFGRNEETQTKDLRPGDKLAFQSVGTMGTNPRVRPSPFGIAHGVVFGDGTRFVTGKTGTATVTLHGAKRIDLLPYFHGHHVIEGSDPDKYAEPFVRVCDLPRFFKDPPPLDEAPSYLYGWLAGYFATDGSANHGRATITCAKRSNLETVRDIATRLGIVTHPITSVTRQGMGEEPSQLYCVSFAEQTLGEDFYVRPHHRAQSLLGTTAKRWRVARRWRVVSVEETDRVEEVFCAIVPTTESFVLEDNILTGNCRAKTDASLPLFRDSGTSMRFLAWMRATTTGDLAELDFPLDAETRAGLVSTPDECDGRDCPFHDSCFGQEARRRAERADVVVVNHTLLCIDAALRDRTDDGVAVLPDRDLVVCDEAHSLEDVATDAFTAEISQFSVSSLLRGKLPALAELDEAVMNDARRAGDAFFAYLARDERPTHAVVPTDDLQLLALAVQVPLRQLARQARATAQDHDEKVARKLERYADRLRALADLFTDVLVTDEDDHVLYVERTVSSRGREVVLLKRAPISVAPDLRRALWDRWPVVATSATLTAVDPETARPGFAFFRERCGAPDGATAVVPSPFDFARNALLYLPADARAFDPSIGRDYQDGSVVYFDRLAREVEALLLASDGRAFCLFTSRRALDEVHRRIAHRLRWNVLRQGGFGTQETVRRFRQDGHAVLFGLRSYMTGVDVSGEALSLVIVDKLPFASPDDPVYAARCDALNRAYVDRWAWFNRLAVPAATILLKQAVGRLIRSTTDRGVVALLDGRLTTKRYGNGILSCLPPMTRTRSLDVVRAFFAGAGVEAQVALL